MTPQEASQKTADVCALAPVVPVLVVNDVAHARPLAEALIAGGLPALEVTLRTPCALDVIREMAKVEGGVVGAGTLLTPADVKAAVAAGATFGVSPGRPIRFWMPARPRACRFWRGPPRRPTSCVCLSAAIPWPSFSPPRPMAAHLRSKASVGRCHR